MQTLGTGTSGRLAQEHFDSETDRFAVFSLKNI